MLLRPFRALRCVWARKPGRRSQLTLLALPWAGMWLPLQGEDIERRFMLKRLVWRLHLRMLEEIVSLSDRILVIYEGRIVAEFPPDVSEEEVGIAMTGGRRREAA